MNTMQTDSFTANLRRNFNDGKNEVESLKKVVMDAAQIIKSSTQVNDDIEQEIIKTQVEKLKQEVILIKEEIKKAQMSLKIDRCDIARYNINTLCDLREKEISLKNIDLDIEIASNVIEMRLNDINEEELSIKTCDDIIESCSITCRDLKKALNKTNIYDVIKNAKKNGWTIKIEDDMVSLFGKDGNLIVPATEDYNNDIEKDETKFIEKK